MIENKISGMEDNIGSLSEFIEGYLQRKIDCVEKRLEINASYVNGSHIKINEIERKIDSLISHLGLKFEKIPAQDEKLRVCKL